jgi:hypothetical protein
METNGRVEVSSIILDLSTRWRWLSSFIPWPLYSPRREPPVPIGKEAGWAPELVWLLWKRENLECWLSSPYPIGIPADLSILLWIL